ncbi:STAS domain-containing protein [uncultured Paludibaculum sp.]|uniref:STAS domain-containing protein n=1 Tax=uncultured Paludibaculum sp. TaxID=1765020 RepID=UPI002AAA62FA|nr:STAS domain-containing protein [uncultured Paludibaculum sp.]
MEILQTAVDREWKVRGAVEIADVEELHDALCGVVGGHPNSMVDLSEVESCDAASMQLLCSAVKTAERLGGRLTLKAPSDAVEACCAVLGLSFGVTKDLDQRAAVELLGAGSGGASAGGPTSGVEAGGGRVS